MTTENNDYQGGDAQSQSPQGDGGRVDNREFRRNRYRECYCRGRNKNCPKCQGTGQLLPNWRENLQAARAARGPQGSPSGSPAPAGTSQGYAPQARQDTGGGGGGEVRQDRPERSDRYERNDRDRGDRGDRGDRDRDRGDRWRDRRDRGRDRERGGSRKSGSSQSRIKECPMCGEIVPNLRAHVLARHDDPVPD